MDSYEKQLAIGILTGLLDAVEADNDFDIEILLDILNDITHALQVHIEIKEMLGDDHGLST